MQSLSHGQTWLKILSAVLVTAGISVMSTNVEAGLWCKDAGCVSCGDNGCGADPGCGDSCCDVDKCFGHSGCSLFGKICGKHSCLGGCSDACGDPGCGDGCGDGCGMESGGCSWCDLGDPFTLTGDDAPIKIGGWFQVGYSDGTDNLFQDNPNRVNLHQGWLFAEKVADGSEGLDFGFRGDIMYGTDADDTQAFGNNPGNWDFQNGFDRGGGYGWAIPQAYGQVASGDLSVIVGHFYTPLGYEVVGATGNFFFSHAFTMFNSEPFTHTGALATYSAGENLTLRGGWSAGWDTGYDRRNDGNNFIGGFTYNIAESTAFTYNTTIGNFGNIGHGYAHSIVITESLTEKIDIVFQSDLIEVDNNETVGAMGYFFYKFNDCLKAGSRWEWWKTNGNSLTAVTYGWNIRPHANIVVRPEYKYISSEHDDATIGFPVNTGIFSIDTVVTF